MSKANTRQDLLVDVRSVSKKFCRELKRSLWYGIQDIGRELRGHGDVDRTALRPGEFLAVDDVSFQVRAGESFALIGRNGAGKSTLLKMINGLIKPDAGSVTIRGRVGALIELGTGFNPLLTGRENIYVNASVLGIGRKEVDRKLDAIIDFAEVGDFIDMPLKSYSSGMRVRLGFAVGAQIQPDLLLIDEVLAVGDAAFRVKCYRRLSELLEAGTAFIMVSHNHHTLLSVCQQAVGLERGRVIGNGPVREVLAEYERRLNTVAPTAPMGIHASSNKADQPFRILDVFWRDAEGNRAAAAQTGRPSQLCVACEAHSPMSRVSLDIMLREPTRGAAPVLAVTAGQDDRRQPVPSGRFEYRMAMDPVCLRPGSYACKISLNRPPMHVLDVVENAILDVEPSEPIGDSLFYHPRHWRVVPEAQLDTASAPPFAVPLAG